MERYLEPISVRSWVWAISWLIAVVVGVAWAVWPAATVTVENRMNIKVLHDKADVWHLPIQPPPDP